MTQGCWALGAVLGSFFGAQIAAWLGRRRAYALISLGATALTLTMFLGTAPLEPSFLPIVFAQGFVATLFFGWLPLYLPELFPTHVRAAGSGIAYNVGRFATAVGVFFAGILFSAVGGSYQRVGSLCGLIYALGLIVIWWAPDTSTKKLRNEKSRKKVRPHRPRQKQRSYRWMIRFKDLPADAFSTWGLTPGTVISPELKNFFGDPRGYRVRGTLIALRKEQAAKIKIIAR